MYLSGVSFPPPFSAIIALQGDGTWHFAMSVFLIELYRHNPLLTAVFGLVMTGSILIFVVLFGNWVNRKPRNKGKAFLWDTGDVWPYDLTSFGILHHEINHQTVLNSSGA